MVEWTASLIANSTSGSFSSQSVGGSWVMHLNISSITLCDRSFAPSLCGWNDVLIATLVPRSRHNSCQNFEVNRVSLSLTILSDNPWCLNISWKYSLAVSAAPHVMLNLIRWTLFETESMMTRIESWPLPVLGRSVIKSIDISDQRLSGGMSGVNLPILGWCLALLLWHSWHPLTYRSISSCIFGQ